PPSSTLCPYTTLFRSLTTTLSENENLVVFDFAHGRRELTHYLGCFGSQTCAFAAANELTQYALADNGWVAEVWELASAYGQFPSDRKSTRLNSSHRTI